MTQDFFTGFVQQTLILAISISAPMLVMGLLVGVLVSVFQAVTQINEQTLVFIPKMMAMGLGLLLFGGWMLNRIISFTQTVYGMLPAMVH